MCRDPRGTQRKVRETEQLERTQMKPANSLKDVIYESHSVRNR